MKKRESPRTWFGRPAALEVATDLPPPFRLLKLREAADAFDFARSIAPSEGAGTLVLVGRFDVMEFAAVLEPDEPLGSTRLVFYAGMNALADTLSALAPPERPINIAWPDAIHVDGGLVGGGRLAWPEGVREDAVPDWIVFGALIRTANISGDPTALVLTAALQDQGFSTESGEHVVAKFSRHLMSGIDTWRSVGFEVLARRYLQRLETKKGAASSIAPDGNLLVKWRGMAEPELHSLRDALRHPSWIDRIGGGGRA
jgi:hypothetical protein